MNLTQTGVKKRLRFLAYTRPFRRPGKSNIEVKISDRMGQFQETLK